MTENKFIKLALTGVFVSFTYVGNSSFMAVGMPDETRVVQWHA
jgi:hypothetical protein